MVRRKLPSLPTFARPPFKTDAFGLKIWGVDEFGGPCMVADIRGWGYLTGKGQALGLSSGEAVEAQKRTAQFIADAMNEKCERDGNPQ